LNKVEPSVVNRCFNLFTKDNVRSALADEVEPGRPEMALVGNAPPCTSGAEWLTGATACPNRSILGPSGKAQGVAPATESREKVTLNKSVKITCADILDAPRIDFTLG
jgi:hypothetical protein